MTTRVEGFMEFLMVEKNASGNTISAYRADLALFEGHLRKQKIAGWSAVKEADIKTFLEYLASKGYKPATIARRQAVVASFFHYLAAEGLLRDDPSQFLPATKVTRDRPQVLSYQEETVVTSYLASSNAERRRDLAIFLILLHTGVKITPLISLNVDDVDLETRPVILRHPKIALLQVPDAAAEALKIYVQFARPRLLRQRNERALFINQREGLRLSRQGVWQLLRQIARDTGIAESHMNSQALRNTFAVRLYNRSQDLGVVQEQLGFSARSTAERFRLPALV